MLFEWALDNKKNANSSWDLCSNVKWCTVLPSAFSHLGVIKCSTALEPNDLEKHLKWLSGRWKLIQQRLPFPILVLIQATQLHKAFMSVPWTTYLQAGSLFQFNPYWAIQSNDIWVTCFQASAKTGQNKMGWFPYGRLAIQQWHSQQKHLLGIWDHGDDWQQWMW